VTLLFTLALAGSVHADNDLRILTWNVESGGSDPATIAKRLRTFTDYQIIALQEVHADEFKRYGKALGFKAVESKTGGGDRLMILYDSERLALVDYRE